MKPKVTIIVPTYNRYELLKKCMKSLQNQTYRNIEIIVVNNGSEDKTSIYLKKLKEKDSRIKLIEFEKNTGSPYACYNVGIKEAKGEYITFMYDDDKLILNAIEEIISFDYCDVIVASCIDEISNKLTVKSYGTKSRAITISDMLNSNQGYGEESINFVKSYILKQYNFDTKAYGGEGLVWIDIVNRHGAFYLHKGIRIYKKNENHIQFTGYDNYFANLEKIIYSSEEYLKLYNKVNAYSFARKRYCKQILLLMFLYLYLGDRSKIQTLFKDIKCFKNKLLIPFIFFGSMLPNKILRNFLSKINQFRILLRREN